MQVFDAIAQPKRREILRLLSGRELSAGQIASPLRRDPAGDLAASKGAQGRRAGERAPRWHEADAERAGGGTRRAARLSRPGPAGGACPPRRGGRGGGAEGAER